METKLLATDTPASLAAAVEAAVQALTAGEPVALPTETVYGLAADALRPEAVVKIFEAKERPFFDPLIVHLPDRAWLERVATIPEESRALIEALIAKFWPGPLTLVLPRRQIVPDLVTSGLETVAVRMSAHPVFRAVSERFGKPLAAPSANRFGRISPTAAAHVRSELDGRIPLIIDGGATEHGLESTIVKVEGTRLMILRAGPVTPEDLASFGKVEYAIAGTQPDAPGQLQSHYAPRTRTILVEPGVHVRYNAERTGKLNWRGHGEGPSSGRVCAVVKVLSETGNLREAAATLFSKMRELDEAGLDLILAEPVPEEGLGIAIMDRLRKAAAQHV
jgi:L-threonylcarbamoyladenylate synthase